MNRHTGDYYESMKAALEAGEKQEDLIEVNARLDQVKKLSADIKKLRAMEVPKSRNDK